MYGSASECRATRFLTHELSGKEALPVLLSPAVSLLAGFCPTTFIVFRPLARYSWPPVYGAETHDDHQIEPELLSRSVAERRIKDFDARDKSYEGKNCDCDGLLLIVLPSAEATFSRYYGRP